MNRIGFFLGVLVASTLMVALGSITVHARVFTDGTWTYEFKDLAIISPEPHINYRYPIRVKNNGVGVPNVNVWLEIPAAGCRDLGFCGVSHCNTSSIVAVDQTDAGGYVFLDIQGGGCGYSLTTLDELHLYASSYSSGSSPVWSNVSIVSPDVTPYSLGSENSSHTIAVSISDATQWTDRLANNAYDDTCFILHEGNLYTTLQDLVLITPAVAYAYSCNEPSNYP